MQTIKKITGTISAIVDLSATARDITISLEAPLHFNAGSFVNVFVPTATGTERRAFSISSSDLTGDTITISIRHNPSGKVSPMFWGQNVIGTTVQVMGPLGLNTADIMLSKRVFLFGFGVGAGVIKSLADHFLKRPAIESITIITGNRDATEILHKDYFDSISTKPKVSCTYVVSTTLPDYDYPTGYIQDHLGGLDFNNCLVYVCGQEVACQAVIDTVKRAAPQNCQFFVEGFH